MALNDVPLVYHDGLRYRVATGVQSFDDETYGMKRTVPPGSADQVDVETVTTKGANTGTAAAGLTALNATFNNVEVMNDFASLQRDVGALKTLLSATRTALVAQGLMKGSE